MNKQQAKEKLAELEQKAAELRAIIDKPEVKPLFPRSWEEGARYVAKFSGMIAVLTSVESDSFVFELALQGRTFYTREEAESFAKRERARAYCLERINEVNKGNNGFDTKDVNYFVYHDYSSKVTNQGLVYSVQRLEAWEYIRTREAAEQLINDPEFVENWKIWKGIE